MSSPRRPELLLALAALLLYGGIQLRGLGHPLLWQDEGETAMYARRVVEFGYPKVHGPRNVVYEFGTDAALGLKEGIDAYIGTTWGHFYYAVPGLLWARASDDLHEKTRRLRLPFALAGLAGVLTWLWAVWPALAGRPGRAACFAAAYFGLLALSVSLQLHLRELRYYPLLVWVVGAIAGLHLRRNLFRTLGPWTYGVAMTLLLWLLFQIFFAASFALLLLLGAELSWRGLRARGAERRRAWLDALPLAAALLAIAPLLVFFETFQIAAAFREELGGSLARSARNLAGVGVHFLRQELLAPALVTRAWLLWRDARSPGALPRPERRVADRLSLFALGYAALTCLNPLVYERYTVLLSPVVTLIFLLDAFCLARGSRRRGALLVALAVLGCLPRSHEIAGRAAELISPVRGPLDFALPYLRERYADPSSLVIATNYENHPLMFYLDARVIIGTNLSNLLEDRRLEPDVVLPRRRWRVGLTELQRFLAAGDFERHALPVVDLHWNTNPAVSATPAVPDPHRFRTARPEDEAQALELYLRREPDR